MSRPSIISCPSPNFDPRPPNAPIDILLLHYTGMVSADAALQRLCDAEARVSAHYTVDEDGTIYAHVPEECRAWHAGRSYWAGETDINGRAVGVEIVNPGHEFGYRSFPDRQIAAVIALSRDILGRQAIPPERVLGHSDVAPARKTDPGELFPWPRLAEAGVGLWPAPALRPPESFDAGLRRFGYGVAPEADASFAQAVTAFQRHWRPERIDGRPDEQCGQILAGLLAGLDPNR